ncbi:hypothetical protein JCM11641_004583 [Rhodosporidiobolus odoratus]
MNSLVTLLALPALVLAAPATLQLPFSSPPSLSSSNPSPFEAALANARFVNVQLGVMSRCPDAQLCEAVFDRVLETKVEVPLAGREGTKAQTSVGELVEMGMIYIGRENSTASYGADCMHGDLECRGNVQQLCAAKHWGGGVDEVKAMVGGPKGKQGWDTWWNFVQCINYGETSAIGTDQRARQCAAVVGKKWDDSLTTCVDSREGRHLLVDSVREAKKLEITKSCTVLIEGKQVCIHDGTWKSCPIGHEVADFAKAIKEEFLLLNPSFGMEEPEEDAGPDELGGWVLVEA